MLLTSMLITGGILYFGTKSPAYQRWTQPQPWLRNQYLTNKRRNTALSAIYEPISRIASVNDKTKTLLFSNNRRQQFKDIGLPTVRQDGNAGEKRLRNQVVVISISLLLASIGSVGVPYLGLVSTVGVIYAAYPIFQDAYYTLFHERRVKMSTIDTVIIAGGLALGRFFAVALGGWIVILSHLLAMKTEDRSQKSLINVFGEQPRFVWAQKDDIEVETPIESLEIDDVVVGHAGEIIAIDGTIIDGIASIDQHLLTGESQPAELSVGDHVFASTMILAGKICIRVDKVGQDTVAAQIGDILLSAADFKTTIERRGESLGNRFASPTLMLGMLTLPVLGPYRAIGVLYANFGYDLRVTGPISMLSCLQLASQKGILVKDGRAIESLHGIDTIVFDKTGTLTLDQPSIHQIYTFNGLDENHLLTYAAAAEYRQTHPVAKAILQEAEKRGLKLPSINDSRYEIGYGVKVQIVEKVVRVGSAQFIKMEGLSLPTKLDSVYEVGQKLGHSFIFIAINDQVDGAIAFQSSIRPEARRLVRSLKQRNISLYILSGDHEAPTRELAQQLGIDHYFSGVLPEEKAHRIEQLKAEGKSICFIGDGINDAIALKQANVSISLRGASTVATDTAQIILMNGRLDQLDQLLTLSQALHRNMNHNIFIAAIFSLSIIGGVYFFHYGMIGSLLIASGSTLLGLGNATLPWIKFRD